MSDTEKLRKAVEHFQFQALPRHGSSSTPCTVHDLETVIHELSKVLNVFIDELEL